MTRREIFRNIIASLLPLALTLAALEIALRATNLATDVPYVEGNEDLGFQYIPNQIGTFVVGKFGEIKASYHINSNGWNATRNYQEKRDHVKARVAVIGDSYVEAFQVPPSAAMPAVLERRLLQKINVEVYSFGIAGASLSHYLAMMRYVRKRFAPDLYILNIVHNDFLESLATADRAIFHGVRPELDSYEEVRPRAYQPSLFRRIMGHSSIARYFYVNLKLGDRIEHIVQIYNHNRRQEHSKAQFEANTDVSQIDMKAMDHLVEYIFKKYLREVDGDRGKLVLVMDASRQPIYEGGNPNTTRAFQYNKLTRDNCRDLLLYCLDLTEHFWSDFQQNNRRFNPMIDGHWNAYGHEVAANQIEQFLHKHGLPSTGQGAMVSQGS